MNTPSAVNQMNRALADRTVQHLGLIGAELGRRFGPVSDETRPVDE